MNSSTSAPSRTEPRTDSRELFGQLMRVGDIGQEKVISHFETQGHTLLGLNHDKRYDVQMRGPGGRDVLIEVKTDTTASPNLAVETWSRTSPSGIYGTQADWYCVYFTQSGELWLFPVPALRAELSDRMGLGLKPVRAIQGTNTWVKLVPKSLARTWGFTQVMQLEPEPRATGISVLNPPDGPGRISA